MFFIVSYCCYSILRRKFHIFFSTKSKFLRRTGASRQVSTEITRRVPFSLLSYRQNATATGRRYENTVFNRFQSPENSLTKSGTRKETISCNEVLFLYLNSPPVRRPVLPRRTNWWSNHKAQNYSTIESLTL